jgi:hypothetical protein
MKNMTQICSIGCVARGEFEAIEKVKKVVEEVKS